MEATPLNKKKAPKGDVAGGALPSAGQEEAAVEPSSAGGAAAAVAGVRTSGGGGEDDDEQVERFYALLENIRAVRGMLGTAAGGATATAAAAGRKRAREAEPPWRPAFRMEDFELVEEVQSDAAPASCDGNKRNRWEGSCGGGAGRREMTTTDGEVVEAKVPRRARQQHKARRAGVLAAEGARHRQ
ncbi:unnamed protein product [Urochloa humidicola]